MTHYKCPSCSREHTIDGKLSLVICPGCMSEMKEVPEPKINIEKNAEFSPYLDAKSSVKIIKNSRGINWEIKIVTGEEQLIDSLMVKAIEVHKKIEESLK